MSHVRPDFGNETISACNRSLSARMVSGVRYAAAAVRLTGQRHKRRACVQTCAVAASALVRLPRHCKS
eukprot:6202791-Pleurochrysis_carterae.AAC.7